MLLPHRNPLLYREVRNRLRPNKLLILSIALLGFLGLSLTYIILLNTPYLRKIEALDWRLVWGQFAVVVMVLQVFCAFYMALGQASDCIGREKTRRTYDFLTTLPVSATDKALGLAVGVNLYPLLILVLLAPVVFVAGVAGGYSLATLIWFHALVAAAFMTASMVGVAASSGIMGGRSGWLIVVVLLMFDLGLKEAMVEKEFLVPPLLSLSPYAMTRVLLTPTDKLAWVFQAGRYHCYRWIVPWQVAPLCFLGFLWIVSFAMARTKLSRPSNPPLHRGVVLIAFIVFQALLVGFLADALKSVERERSIIAGLLLMVNFFLILVWGFAGQPNYAALMQWAGKGRHWLGRLVSQPLTTVQGPNPLAAGVLWVIAVAAVLAVDRLYWRTLSYGRVLLVGAILLVYLLTYLSLSVVGCAASRRYGRALGLILVTVCIMVPSIFSTLEGRERLLDATPMAIFGQIFSVGGCSSTWCEYHGPLDRAAGESSFSWQWSLGFAIGELAVFGTLALLALGKLARRVPRGGSPTQVT